MFQSIDRVADWIKKKKTLQYAAYMRPTWWQRTQIRSDGTEKDISCIGNKRRAEVAILKLTSDKTNFKTKAMKKDEGTT